MKEEKFQIRELAKQAGFMPSNFISRWDAEFVLFAELIVKECIDIVGVGGEFASRSKLVEKLQEHFGVEDD